MFPFYKPARISAPPRPAPLSVPLARGSAVSSDGAAAAPTLGGARTTVVDTALAALLTARGSLHETRNANESLDRAGVGALWALLSPGEVAATVRALTEHVGSGGRDPVWRRYVEFCESKGIAAVPVSRSSVANYFANYVFISKNKSSSLPKILSGLRCYTRLANPEAWMPAQEEELVKLDVTAIQKAAPATTDPTVALDRDQLLAAVRAAKGDGTAHGRQAAALLTVLTGLQARGEEVFGNGTLTFEDFVFTAAGLCVDQYLGKSTKTFVRARPKAAIHFPAELADLCASRALREHLSVDSQWSPAWATDPDNMRWPVFSVLKKCGATGKFTCSSTPLTTGAAKALMLQYLAKAGVPDPGLDIHFGRPSGTDLYEFDARLISDMIEALGGWAPTTTLSKFYQRHTSQKLAELAMTMVRERFPAGFRACCDP